MNFKNENIWIIGASSGIGRELVIQLAELGANMILSARRENELKKLNQELINRQLNGNHKVYPIDISNYNLVKELYIKLLKQQIKIDRVIFMSAIYKPDSIANMDIDFASKMIDVNIKGLLYITKTILPLFEKQKFGQIVICGSVSGYIGLPNGQPYSATKAALINFAESLYAECPDYINVKLINPGFVRTDLTKKNDFNMPMIIEPSQAAKYIINGLKKNSFEIHFPKKFTFILKLLSLLPYKLKLYFIKNFIKYK